MGGFKTTSRIYGYPCIMCKINQVDVVSQCGHACYCKSCADICMALRSKCPICDIIISISSPKREVGFLWNIYVDSTFRILLNMTGRDFSRDYAINSSEVGIIYAALLRPIERVSNQINTHARTISSNSHIYLVDIYN